MKKTNEQIKQEVIEYLTKTSKHTFSYEDGKLFKIVMKDDKFFIVDENSFRKVTEINIDNYIHYNSSNSKCVIKHRLFLNRKVKSTRTNRYTSETIECIIDPSKIRSLA